MGSTVGDRYVTGTVTATGASLDFRKVGFKPRKVQILNQTNQCRAEWNEQLPDAYAVLKVAAGDLTIVTSTGVTPIDGTSTLPPGFNLGIMVNINDTSTEILSYEAWG